MHAAKIGNYTGVEIDVEIALYNLHRESGSADDFFPTSLVARYACRSINATRKALHRLSGADIGAVIRTAFERPVLWQLSNRVLAEYDAINGGN